MEIFYKLGRVGQDHFALFSCTYINRHRSHRHVLWERFLCLQL